ncbi:MAG: hypothetical protein WCL00_02960 [Bacteroidota bacterium]
MNNTRFKSLLADCHCERSEANELQITNSLLLHEKGIKVEVNPARKLFCLLLSLLLIISGYSQKKTSAFPDCVRVSFQVTDSTFPAHWYRAEINATATPLSSSEVDNVLNILSQTLSKYPQEVICKYLKHIYVFKRMQFYNVPFGGTSYKETVYITDDEENLTCSYDLLENYFHHEFSSVLLSKNKCKLEKWKWRRLNPKGFRYGKGGLDAILTGNAEMTFDPVLNERGFLTHYSEASLEEDFNVYCQNVFNGGPEFWRLVETYSKIREKTELVIHFYHRIDISFTQENFIIRTEE